MSEPQHEEVPDQPLQPQFGIPNLWKNLFTWSTLLVIAGFFAYLSASQISRAYVDFGDGNYLYISSRMAEGSVPYRDIMAPQPPLHLLLGSIVLKIGARLGAELLLIRWTSILLHIAIAFVVASIARFACLSIWPAVAAGAISLFMPVGFIWSLGYQSEPLEILFLALMVRMILPMRAPFIMLAALFAALACFTNMTALPYALLTFFWLIWRKGWLTIAFILPFALLMTLGIMGMEAWSEGNYLQNVFFNQVGTYPKGQLLGYAFTKIFSEGADVVSQEGFPLALALLGMALCIWRERENHLEYLALFSMFSLGSIVFVSKGGTMDYIFTLGEPYVAIFAGCLFAWLFRSLESVERPPMLHRILAITALVAGTLIMLWREFLLIKTIQQGAAALMMAQAVLEPILFVTFATLTIIKITGRAMPHRSVATVAATSSLAALAIFAWHTAVVLEFSVFKGGTYQLPPERTEQIAQLVRQYSRPREAIISPPWFAYDTGRTLTGEYSETFIWTIGYFNELADRVPGMAASIFDGPFTQKTLEVADALERQRVPLVILDSEQTGRIPEIKRPLDGSTSYPFLTFEEVQDPALARGLLNPSNKVALKVMQLLSPVTAKELRQGSQMNQRSQQYLLEELNQSVIGNVSRVTTYPPRFRSAFYDEKAFEGVAFSGRARQMLSQPLALEDVRRLNRRLLAEAGLTPLRPAGAKYQELTELVFETRDTPLRFYVPVEQGQATEPPALTFDDLMSNLQSAPGASQPPSP